MHFHNKGTDAKRLRKELPKLIKSLEASDQIYVVGITELPWEADVKQLCSVYQDILVVPRPDFQARYKMLEALLPELKALKMNSLYFTLASVADGHTLGTLKSVVSNTRLLYKTRKCIASNKSGFVKRFIFFLSHSEPIDANVERKYAEWYKKTTEGKFIEDVKKELSS